MDDADLRRQIAESRRQWRVDREHARQRAEQMHENAARLSELATVTGTAPPELQRQILRLVQDLVADHTRQLIALETRLYDLEEQVSMGEGSLLERYLQHLEDHS